jgi:hypothetical protein
MNIHSQMQNTNVVNVIGGTYIQFGTLHDTQYGHLLQTTIDVKLNHVTPLCKCPTFNYDESFEHRGQ